MEVVIIQIDKYSYSTDNDNNCSSGCRAGTWGQYWLVILDSDCTAPEAEIPAESERSDEKAQNYRRGEMWH